MGSVSYTCPCSIQKCVPRWDLFCRNIPQIEVHFRAVNYLRLRRFYSILYYGVICPSRLLATKETGQYSPEYHPDFDPYLDPYHDRTGQHPLTHDEMLILKKSVFAIHSGIVWHRMIPLGTVLLHFESLPLRQRKACNPKGYRLFLCPLTLARFLKAYYKAYY